MKSKTKISLFQSSLKDLQSKLEKATSDLLKLRLDHKNNQLKDPKKLTRTRHQIAVIKTFINQKKN